MRTRVVGILAGAAALTIGGQVFAAIQGAAIGTSAPPASMFGVTYTPFAVDSREPGTQVTTVASPLGGDVTFGHTREATSIDVGWATWSNGYTGNVYPDSNEGSVQSETLTLPSGTNGFYFYAESNTFEIHSFTVVAENGPTLIDPNITGNSGAGGFVFWATGGDTIKSITVSSDDSFALGQFGISQVPEPAAISLLVVPAMLALRRRKA